MPASYSYGFVYNLGDLNMDGAVYLFPSAGFAASCAKGLRWRNLHGHGPAKQVDAATVFLPNPPNSSLIPGTTGSYETVVSSGNALVSGDEVTAHDAAQAEIYLKGVARQIG